MEILLGIIFFVVVPLINYAIERQNKAKRQAQASTDAPANESLEEILREARERVRQKEQGAAPPLVSAKTPEAPSQSFQEAVQRAREGTSTSSAPSTMPAPAPWTPARTPAPAPRGAPPMQEWAPRGEPLAPPADPTPLGRASRLGRPATTMKHDARSLEGGSSESGSSETFTTEAASLEVIPDNPSDTPRTFTDIASSMDVLPLSRGSQPAKNDKRAKISVRDLYFHEEALAQGLIWHQVLSPPRSKSRRTRL